MENPKKLRFGPYVTGLYFHESPDFLPFDDEPAVLHIFDETTNQLFGRDISPKVIIGRGEEAKNWQSVEKILQMAVANDLARDALFVAVGGGIVCDIGAFAASVFMRGCRAALVPTTLLSMVDASLGGKTGFNFSGYKNMVGTFYPAESVHLYPAALQSLPDEGLLAGLAETIKHACLGDETLFEILERDREKIMARDPDVLCRIIERSVMVKAGIVSKDLKETGVRAYLNLGHTFAHALESILSLKESRHGEAVAWGLVKAMETGLKLGVTDQIYARRVIDLVRVYGFDLDKRVDIDKFLAAAGKDKKRRDGKVRYVLQREMGETLLQEVDREIISSILSTG